MAHVDVLMMAINLSINFNNIHVTKVTKVLQCDVTMIIVLQQLTADVAEVYNFWSNAVINW